MFLHTRLDFDACFPALILIPYSCVLDIYWLAIRSAACPGYTFRRTFPLVRNLLLLVFS
jgi:hypothetical protein